MKMPRLFMCFPKLHFDSTQMLLLTLDSDS
jgi:hypothetical protein